MFYSLNDLRRLTNYQLDSLLDRLKEIYNDRTNKREITEERDPDGFN